MKSTSQRPGQQQGVALITALLIVALATIISVSISTQLQLDVRRTGNILASEQAMLHTLFAEKVARRYLRDDRIDNIIDHTGEDWAIPREFLVEGGAVRGQLYDLQACFNLNSLYSTNAANRAATQLAGVRFSRLLDILQANTTPDPNINSNLIAQSIIDWIDDNLDGNAEDVHYMNLEKPYRAANAHIQSASELRVIRGFEESKTFDALKNGNRTNADLEYLVCAFGVDADINVNTAPAEVLESLANNITASDAQDIIDRRPYDSLTDFITRNNLGTIIPSAQQNELSVDTNYFLLETEAIIGQARTLMYSIIQRQTNGDTEVISRTFGAY